MKQYANSVDSCLRKILYEKFDKNEVQQPTVKHDCCSFCFSVCNCQDDGSCSKFESYYGQKQDLSLTDECVRTASDEQKELFLTQLKYFKSDLEQNIRVSFTEKEYMTGLSFKSIEETAQKLNFINNTALILNSTPFININKLVKFC